jgi:hypothetical protein
MLPVLSRLKILLKIPNYYSFLASKAATPKGLGAKIGNSFNKTLFR